MSDLIVQGQTWVAMKEQAKILIDSGLLPATIKKEEEALAIGIMGHEIGMPLMWSFQNIDVILKKPTLKPQGMLAMIYKNCPGSEVNYTETSNDKCSLKAKRPGGEWNYFTFTLENARLLGLLNKDNWRKQPDVMLQWRCVGKMARALFPDAIAGVSYTPEEMGAKIDSDGNVVKDKHGNVVLDVEVTNESDSKSKAAGATNEKGTADTSGSNQNTSATETKKTEEKKGFDKTKLEHINWIIGKLEVLGVTDKDDIESVMLEMQGRQSSELEKCLEEMYQRAKPKPVELSSDPLEPTGNPDIDAALAKINSKIGKKKTVILPSPFGPVAE